jgi:tetratricopeptide (TPR) repeat protein
MDKHGLTHRYLFTRSGLDYDASHGSLANINWTGTSVDRSPWTHEIQVNSLKDRVHFMDVLVGIKPGPVDMSYRKAGPESLNEAYSTELFRDKVSLWRLNVIDGKQVNKDNSIASWKEDTFFEPLKKSFSRSAVQDQVMSEAFAACQAQAARGNQQATAAADRIARVYREQDQMGDAERVYRWIVSVDERARPESNELAPARGDLAFVLGKRGKLAESIESYEKAVALLSKQPKYDASLAYTLQSLAPAYTQAGKLAEAVSAYEKASDILQRHGWEHDIPQMRCQIALIWLKQGDLVRAETIMKKQLAESLEKQKPTPRPIPVQHMAFCHAMRARAILGIIYTRQHKYGEAEPLFKAAIPHLGKRYYSWHDAGSSGQQSFEPDIVRAAFDSYGNLLRATNRANEADSLAAKYGGDANKSNNGPPSRGVRL